MLRIAKWGGLVTQASPYAVPPGGATAQVNFTLATPGQLTSRPGMKEMRDVNLGGGGGVIEQMWPITGGAGQPDKLVMIDDAGNLTIINGVV